jgi:hypothetical protein
MPLREGSCKFWLYSKYFLEAYMKVMNMPCSDKYDIPKSTSVNFKWYDELTTVPDNRIGGGQCHLMWKVLVFVCVACHSHRFSDPKQKVQV